MAYKLASTGLRSNLWGIKPDGSDAIYKIQELLNDEARMKQMAFSAQKVARPHAAREIVEDVIASLRLSAGMSSGKNL